MKKCGKGDSDHAICLPKGDKCPINDLKLLPPGKTAPTGYKKVELGDGSTLAFTSDADGLPLSRL